MLTSAAAALRRWSAANCLTRSSAASASSSPGSAGLSQLALQRRAFMASSTASASSSGRSVAARPPLLLSPAALSKALSETSSSKAIVTLDATWFMPNLNPPRNARAEFSKGPRIPNSRFWDVDEVADKSVIEGLGSALPHMMPDGSTFAQAASEAGIEPETHVVVYDTHGIFSAPRTAFTFLAFGHQRVSVLDGGLPGWVASNFEVEEGEPKAQILIQKTSYPEPTLLPNRIRSYQEMRSNAALGESRAQAVLDARPQPRFAGTAPEPRPGLSSGHIPASYSLPFSSLLDSKSADDKTYTVLKSQTDLWRVVSGALAARQSSWGAGAGASADEGGNSSVDRLRQESSGQGQVAVTATCGSGMTAAVIWLALQQLGIESAIYDESWTGWASRKDSPIVKDEA
ncbi:unnamed protein product [Tilletia controversa]|uniref:Rhodanese domain-containing protein n=3 Tax=Tilletia TaxID=13289 RepID=A0A8X7N2I0_9BASI|nr:hypothetical protein CF336_g257 [Tilletia laevis]KAE8205531.1 hypothetical protein CF328_g444 [Tilletia controversa]KAE8265479.1 hypothetical protein A4X03_0g236 [Tilletia caries]KAE8208738.1 hypothetical protein CF335_g198 [Tilletia laevis]KAE8256160.1 hypothetical protein A4X06_0g47 [Tilletia controversa]